MPDHASPWSLRDPARSASMPRYRIEFPPPSDARPDQHEAYFHLVEGEARTRIRFHDYRAIYAWPGLYEQLFYDRLKCKSPAKVVDVLSGAVEQVRENPSELRVLDLGAGNGMVGEELARRGVSRLVGADIIDEARAASIRDRPGVYDHYYVLDFTALGSEDRDELRSWSFNALVSVAALGFGDIPPGAIAEAMNLVEVGGWIAFNIKDSFLDVKDGSGFSTMVRQLILSEYLDLHHLERYQHRYAIDGTPLSYFAIVGRKRKQALPADVQETAFGRAG